MVFLLPCIDLILIKKSSENVIVCVPYFRYCVWSGFSMGQGQTVEIADGIVRVFSGFDIAYFCDSSGRNVDGINMSEIIEEINCCSCFIRRVSRQPPVMNIKSGIGKIPCINVKFI